MKHPFLHGYRLTVALCVGVVLLLPAVLDRPNYEKIFVCGAVEN
jgi:hypothetical protein